MIADILIMARLVKRFFQICDINDLPSLLCVLKVRIVKINYSQSLWGMDFKKIEV